jgi:Repeat of Unknown Function (DUF347)
VSGAESKATGQLATMTTIAQPTTTTSRSTSFPEVTLYFWIIEILCTTVGETFADDLNDTLGMGLTNTTYILGTVLLVVLFFQSRQEVHPVDLPARGRADQRRRHADHRQPRSRTSASRCPRPRSASPIARAVTFAAWSATERTLSRRRAARR